MSNPYQVGHNTGSAVTSLHFTVSGATSAGDVLVANVYSTTPPTGVTDSQSNSYVLVNASTLAGASGGNPVAYQYVTTGKTVALGASDTVTVTLSASGNVILGVVGVPGAHYAGVDGLAAGVGASGTLMQATTPALCSGATGEIVIAAIGNGAAKVPTWGGGLTSLFNAQGALTFNLNVAWGSVSSASPLLVSGTISTSAYWAECVVTLQMSSYVGNAPVPPSQQAGVVAKSADMNTLAQTAQFLLRRPMAIARAAPTGGGQAVTGGTAVAVQWSALTRDTDGFWSPAHNTRLTIQTQGIYRARYVVPFANAVGNLGAWVQVTTGSNNPAGSGVVLKSWYSWAGSANSINGSAVGGGIIPGVLWPGDYVEIWALPLSTGNLAVSPQPASCSLVMRST